MLSVDHEKPTSQEAQYVYQDCVVESEEINKGIANKTGHSSTGTVEFRE